MRERDDELGRVLEEDLAALREVSAGEPGSIAETLAAAAARRDRTTAREGSWSMLLRQLKRPRWAMAMSAVVLFVGMLVVPLPYQRAAGHEVSLRVHGVDAAHLAAVAKKVARALGAEHLSVERRDRDGVVFSAQLAQPARDAVDRGVQGVLRGLDARGMHAELLAVTSRSVRASGSVYAMARDKVRALHLDLEGKTAEQIEADLRAQLEEAMVDNTDVHVEKDGDVVSISVHEMREGDWADGAFKDVPEFEFPPGAEIERIEIKVDGGVSDKDLELAAIEAQKSLAKSGIDAEVRVEDGHLRVIQHPKKP